MNSSLFHTTAAFLLLSTLPALADTWTASDGDRTMEADFVSLESNQVTMILDNGRTSTFELSMLVEDDQARVRDLAAGSEPTEVQTQFDGRLKILERSRMGKFDFTENPRYFILYYSASWCGPCRQMAPHSAEFYRNTIADDPRVEVVMISNDREAGAAQSWAEEVDMPWPILMPNDVTRVAIAGQNQPNGIPHMILIDGEGNKLAEGRVDQMRAALNNLD